MTISDVLKKTPVNDKELLLAFVLDQPHSFLFTHPEYTLTHTEEKTFRVLAQRRDAGEPLAYITGTKEFFGRDFVVDHSVLIPRPETELIIDILKKDTPTKTESLYLDIGTGSGAIIVTLAKELATTPTTLLYATDISQEALRVAQKNAQMHNAQIIFLQSDLLTSAAVQQLMHEHDAITIIANLPYVDRANKNHLVHQEESRGLMYEPELALWSDHAGCAHYEKLLKQTEEIYATAPTKEIYCLWEMDPAQKDALTKIIATHFPHAHITFHKDLSDRWRVCEWSV